MKMNDRRPVETIGVRDDDSASTSGFDRWTWSDAVVAPDSRANAGEDLRDGLTLNDFVVVGCRVRSHRREDRWNRKGDPERFDRGTRLSQRRTASREAQ